ncbi:hypothetical protein Pint_29805 [Pistacia integerrima]|uniref:Uncharacterized protein n=1 Tax=Pistacia integerrima TaxID=434235 RepID=A0ACC0X0S4_9ROSI|nr:hypothetical protein Pint_29805 [Pistacia integerrima]
MTEKEKVRMIIMMMRRRRKEEEEAAKEENEDESKPAIKWTEVDQKNLMDLGTSELERNQCLEKLIARSRARKNLRLMTEKNLIDLEDKTHSSI